MNVSKYIYTYVHHKDEFDLCRLEMRAFFGKDTTANILISNVEIDPSRSPFMKERVDVLFEAAQWEDLLEQLQQLDTGQATFKVVCLNSMDLGATEKIGHAGRRKIERESGLQINGEPDLDNPDLYYAIVYWNDCWYFGNYSESKHIWYEHQQKPHMYSTALSTRVARAVANIAVPHPEGIRAIDPCCGIGTVLVEALSMGINIEGRDINPLVVYGSRKNIVHFGLEGDVTIGPIAEVTRQYDVTIIDMPYNLFTHITPEQQLAIVKEARRFTEKIVIVTIESMDDMIHEAGFTIIDRCIARKGTFTREVVVCE